LSSTPVSLTRMLNIHRRGEKFAALTAFDATFAAVACRAGIECLLVSSELAISYQGVQSREGIDLNALEYHVRNVSQGVMSALNSAWLISDLPMHMGHAGNERAISASIRLMKAGAQMIRLPLDKSYRQTASYLTEHGIPVCAYLDCSKAFDLAESLVSIRKSEAQFLMIEKADFKVTEKLKSLLPNCVTVGSNCDSSTTGELISLYEFIGIESGEKRQLNSNFMGLSRDVEKAMSLWVTNIKHQRQSELAMNGC
jgi:3-methyl-2-oxobutanoate hydroxymethyltransferase